MTMDEEQEEKVVFREILVAIDTSKHSQAALEAAASLARMMEATIHGLFVHDEIWNRISKLPSIKTVNELTGQITSFEDESLEDQVRLLKNRLKTKLEQVSRQHELSHSWRSEQGKVEEKILEAAEEADLITIGLRGTSAGRKVLGSSARRIIEKADKPVLILRKGLRLGNTITVVYNSSDESKRGLKIALDIAGKNESTLTVLVLNNESEAEEKIKELENLLKEIPVFAEIKLLENTNISQFLNTLNRQKPGLLILPKNQPIFARSLEFILRHINYPLLLIN